MVSMILIMRSVSNKTRDLGIAL